MTKKIITAIALILSLTACKPAKEEVKEPVKKVEIEASKKSDQKPDKKEAKEEKDTEYKAPTKTKEKTNQDSEIFDKLQGKEFNSYLTNGSERIVFYKDGKFDGAWWSGDGFSMLANLYTGKFSQPKKIDDKTYSVKLETMEYQSPTSGKDPQDENIEYIESQYFDKKMIGDEYIIRLPGTSLAELDKANTGYMFDYNPDVENGIVNMYTFSKTGLDLYPQFASCLFLTESKKAPKRSINGNTNYFAKDIYGENHQETSKNQPATTPKKTTGINIPPEPIGQIDHATQIDMGEVFISNYLVGKEESIGEDLNSNDSIDFIQKSPEAFYNLDYSKDYIDRFEDKTLSDVDFGKSDPQPIIKVLGEIIESKKLREDIDNKYVNIYEYTLLARTRDGEKILISLDYMGDIDTATFITEDGTDLVKAWALPLGTYTIDHKDYGKIKLYKFAGGEGLQEAAFEKYGEGYGF